MFDGALGQSLPFVFEERGGSLETLLRTPLVRTRGLVASEEELRTASSLR